MADFKETMIRSLAGSSIRQVNRLSYPFVKDNGTILRFNTAEFTDNLGDYIIMRYCNEVLRDLYPTGYQFIDVSTHILPTKDQEEQIKKARLKFVCGTNLLTSHIEEHWNWALPDGLRRKLAYKNIILLGVGWKNYDDPCSEYSKMIYKAMLSPCFLHSVRDQYTEEMLKAAGIKNVINTGCPTMWKLTPEFCDTIPSQKARTVITTITDYRRDAERDSRMLAILSRNYACVRLWLQGKRDEEYLSTLTVPDNLETIPRDLKAYEQALEAGDADYVGTRLHAGIFALNHRVRSLIIAVDNRATEMGKDTNLPVVGREAAGEALESLIQANRHTEIRINQKNIIRFKSQFGMEKR